METPSFRSLVPGSAKMGRAANVPSGSVDDLLSMTDSNATIASPCFTQQSAVKRVWYCASAMEGWTSVKDDLWSMWINTDRQPDGQPRRPRVRLLVGNVGSGRKTAGMMYAALWKALGWLSSDQCAIVSLFDVLQSAGIDGFERKMGEMMQRCRGHKLLVMERVCGPLSSRSSSSSSGGGARPCATDGNQQHAWLSSLMGMIEQAQPDIAVVLVVTPQELEAVESNCDLFSSCFPAESRVEFNDFTEKELSVLTKRMIVCSDAESTDEVVNAMVRQLLDQRRSQGGGVNLCELRALVHQSIITMRSTDWQRRELGVSDIPILNKAGGGCRGQTPPLGCATVADALTCVQRVFADLCNVPDVVRQFNREAVIRRQAACLGATNMMWAAKNYLIRGPPGCGKSTIAGRLAEVLYKVGSISRPYTVTRTGRELCGSVGSLTKPRDLINEAMEAAKHGVLVIDRASELCTTPGGEEAVTQLIAQMTSPTHYTRTVIAVVDDEDGIRRLLRCNEGLAGRFTDAVALHAWSADESMAYLQRGFEKAGLGLPPAASTALRAQLDSLAACADWESGRSCASLLCRVLMTHRRSSSFSNSSGMEISREDVLAAFQ